MGWIEKLTKKVADTASSAVGDNVKNEIKEKTISAIPALIGVGSVIFGIIFFGKGDKSNERNSEYISNTKTVTNNYFFGNNLDDEFVKRIIEEGIK